MRLALLTITLVLLGLILLVLLTWEQCQEPFSSFYLDPSTGQRMPVTVCKENNL